MKNGFAGKNESVWGRERVQGREGRKKFGSPIREGGIG